MTKALIIRLSKYKRVLGKLKSLGFVKVFSNNLGDAIGVTPALVRKDLAFINIPGNKRGGYQIDVLIELLSAVLGGNEYHEVIVVGCGNIGTALMRYREFPAEGIRIVAGFDADQERTDESAHVPVLPMSRLADFCRERNIQVAIIAVPDTAAGVVLEQLTACGIQGVLNFAPVELKGSGKCIIHNVNIGLEIENLFYLVHLSGTETGEKGVGLP